MVTVALVGPDGSGKTTIARRLQDELDGGAKYLYMGTNPASSNLSLPSTRLVHQAKVRSVQKSTAATKDEAVAALHGVEHRKRDRGFAWRLARLANRVLEATIRQVVASFHRARGSVVVFDRHPRFEFGVPGKPKKHATERMHHWFVSSVLPEPDLVLLLDAPAEALYERKQEVPLDYLERARRNYRTIASTCRNFVEIDVSQPVDAVMEDVLQQVELACGVRGTTALKEST